MVNTDLLTLFNEIGKLKNIKRSGWVRFEIPNPESVADHSFRCAFMAMVLGDILDVDSLRLMKMAILHDIAEAITGDITPVCGISRQEKVRKEKEGLEQLLKDLPNGKEYMILWKEYEEGETKEARIFKDIDKLEMALQALEYQDVFSDLDLSEFLQTCEREIYSPEIRSLFEEIKRK
ncbi:MAG: HD domain-containing protein [Thermoplasmata archaeon]|nr:MAG: HD domain-containing protein [Thermoplasmata archaeon]